MGLLIRGFLPKLFGDIINSLLYTPDIESDIQIFTDMCPALSSLNEFHQRDFAQQYLSYCASDTSQSPTAKVLPTQVIRQEYYLSETNYNRLSLA